MDGIQSPEKHPWEKKENPQNYELMVSYAEHPKPRQHVLGIVGGNEVPFQSRQSQVEIESDLRGITRANSFCPTRKHSPAEINQASITRNTPKEKVTIKTGLAPLYQSQMWAYPATLAPREHVIETCLRPEKY